MRIRILFPLLSAILVGAVAILPAQILPGKNLTVLVRVRGVVMSHDTATISYSLMNSASSVENLTFFTVNMVVSPQFVSTPDPSSNWRSAIRFRDRTVAKWVALNTIAPGDSTPTLTVRAIGLPGIAQSWYRGDRLPASYEAEPDTTAHNAADYDPLADLSNTIQTVGIEAAPTSLSTLITRLHVLSDSACALGWITNSSLCTALGGDLSASPTKILTFTTSLDSASAHGSDVSASAYGLLKPNAEYIKAFVDTSVVQLHVACAGTWLVRNFNYAPFAGHWSTDVHSDTITVAGRPSDAHEYTDMPIVTSGTYLNLSFNGVVFRSRNRGTWSCP